MSSCDEIDSYEPDESNYDERPTKRITTIKMKVNKCIYNCFVATIRQNRQFLKLRIQEGRAKQLRRPVKCSKCGYVGHTARNKKCPFSHNIAVSMAYNRIPREVDGNDSDEIDDVDSKSEAENAREVSSIDNDDEDAGNSIGYE
jgi:hypothetical protein